MDTRIKNYNNRIEAEIDKEFLKTNGIPCVVMADDAGGMRPDLLMSSGGAWLLVNKKDAEQASKLLKEREVPE